MELKRPVIESFELMFLIWGYENRHPGRETFFLATRENRAASAQNINFMFPVVRVAR
jgi:hypothetical protein